MEYQPLDATNHEIRLLTIISTSPIIWCSLTHHPLRPNALARSFSALSYVWGVSGTTFDVFVNGKPMPVTPNLFWALEQIGGASGYVWVDALCINQKDPAERASQVLRMGEIYSEAKEVVVWLGFGTIESRDAFRLIGRLWREISDPTYTDEEKAEQSLENREWMNCCRAMGRLCQLPYWRRTWISKKSL